jgi:UDP-N-acetylmuramate--alanine ligase
MHIYFSGIGGTGIGPLALVAKKSGFEVSGSDQRDSSYIQYLKGKGIRDIHIGQTKEAIAAIHAKHPIDWFVYTSAMPIEHLGAPELVFCQEQAIKHSKRDEFLNFFLQEKQLQMLAVAGTHGKTTTTAMAIWLCKQLGIPISYSLGAKISFGDMGEYDENSQYFIYEADEFDRNFLEFSPELSIITGVDWDHPDIYPTRDSYDAAFRQFLSQSEMAVLWREDAEKLHSDAGDNLTILDKTDAQIVENLSLPGIVNRENAWQVAHALQKITGKPTGELVLYLNNFPGVARRFEQLAPNLYSDYAHTPPKIRGALQLASEVAGDNVVVIYEGLHNTRQHFIKKDLPHLFDGVKKLYIVPSYLAREDSNLPLLSPEDLRGLLAQETRQKTTAAELDASLKSAIQQNLAENNLVLCISAGGGHSLDEWLRQEFHVS